MPIPSWTLIAQELKDVTLLSTFVRLFLAVVLSGLIGFERGRRRQAAGLRTHMLVCTGATLVMITNQFIVREFNSPDPARLGAQVISGIGFLGVGTIIIDRRQQVRGLTTAAGLWACACMGLALGIGFYSGALIANVFILATITIINKLEHRLINRSMFTDIYVEFSGHRDINPFLVSLHKNGIRVSRVDIIPPKSAIGRPETCVAATMTIQLPVGSEMSRSLYDLSRLPGLLLLEEAMDIEPGTDQPM